MRVRQRLVLHPLILVGLAAGTGITAGGCATMLRPPAASQASTPVKVDGVWDGSSRETVTQGSAAGDIREEQQEWHLSQSGPEVSGYYLATLTFTSGDGRPYVCSQQPQFSLAVRVDVSGSLTGSSLALVELAERASTGPCSLGHRPLARYHAEVAGDLLTLVTATDRQVLHRSRATTEAHAIAAPRAGRDSDVRGVGVLPPQPPPGASQVPRLTTALQSQAPVDLSGVWVWEHSGQASTGDEKQEREEWHVDQDGDHISGYYDRIVREISTDGQAFRCSMNLEFEIATRYQIHGEVRGNQVVIYEKGFEVLAPNACDNGQRRLDAYEGLAASDEVRLMWGVGAQVLRRAHPDVPTQRF